MALSTAKAAPVAKPVAATKADIDVRTRIAYLNVRLKMLQGELRELRLEGREIGTKLRAMTDRTTPEARVLKRRRAYITVRPEYAMAEMQVVVAERKKLNGTGAE